MPEEKEKVEEIELDEFIENVVPGLSVDEYNKIRSQAIEKAKNAKHHWRQSGHYIVCSACEVPHGAWIGPGVEMIGEQEDGTPIFRKI